MALTSPLAPPHLPPCPRPLPLLDTSRARLSHASPSTTKPAPPPPYLLSARAQPRGCPPDPPSLSRAVGADPRRWRRRSGVPLLPLRKSSHPPGSPGAGPSRGRAAALRPAARLGTCPRLGGADPDGGAARDSRRGKLLTTSFRTLLLFFRIVFAARKAAPLGLVQGQADLSVHRDTALTHPFSTSRKCYLS